MIYIFINTQDGKGKYIKNSTNIQDYNNAKSIRCIPKGNALFINNTRDPISIGTYSSSATIDEYPIPWNPENFNRKMRLVQPFIVTFFNNPHLKGAGISFKRNLFEIPKEIKTLHSCTIHYDFSRAKY